MNNNIGTIGVNPYAKLMLINTDLTTSSIIRGIHFAKENGAKVINASRGGTGESDSGYTSIKTAIKAFTDNGGIFIAAAGNAGRDNDGSIKTYPCNLNADNPQIICVAASNPSNQLETGFSNYGENSVDIAAPGVSIISTYYNGSFTYAYKQGTSMATPHIAGAVSLLWTYNPQASATGILQALYSGADTLAENGNNWHIKEDRKLNVYNSLKLLDNKAPIITETGAITTDYCMQGNITYSITGSDDIQLHSTEPYSFDGGQTR
jgi:subtilisin family serine protease